ncbi:MAG TPA: alternative ribosome rescue aminoacyl-tRNA hydrolase ArfB [Rhizomicrobium sp.]
MDRLVVTARIGISESELIESFIQSSGPGGQNVNKVASAVQLRFDVLHSPSLPDPVRVALLRLAGRRLTKEGVLVITARSHREQERNRAEARERLAELVRRAATPQKPRKATRPTRASKERRIQGKKIRARIKQKRARNFED